MFFIKRLSNQWIQQAHRDNLDLCVRDSVHCEADNQTHTPTEEIHVFNSWVKVAYFILC